MGIGQKIDQTHLQDREHQTQRIILWLSTLPFREQHVAIRERVQAGTGDWFIIGGPLFAIVVPTRPSYHVFLMLLIILDPGT
jgi:hypothetical protein